MSHTEKIPLKVFWEAVEGRLATCSVDELRAILREMARHVSPSGRQEFLAQLGIGAIGVPTPGTPWENLLPDIEDLAMEIEEAMASADEWEEEYGWQYEYEEDTLGPYTEFVEPATLLFERAALAFDHGEIALARQAYHKLFELLDLEDDYGRGVSPSDLAGVDVSEAWARYLRAVYETESPERRPLVLFEQMLQVRSWVAGGRPKLDDLIHISLQPLPDQEQFLTDWIAFLRTQGGSEADAWLREAVRLSQGRRGLEELARAEGQRRPRAYLDWFTALELEGKSREVLLAAQEALRTLPAGLPIRAAIADHLCAAAARLDEPEVLRTGRWEAFLAKPTLSRLLDLWEAVPAGDGRTTLMRQAVGHVRHCLAHPPSREVEVWPGEDDLERPVWVGKSVLAHACLLAEDFQAVHQLAAGERVLGWSSSDNPQGLVVAFFLALLSGKAPGALPPNLAQLWEWGLQFSIGFWVDREGEDPLPRRLERVYKEQFARMSLSPERQEAFLSWCLDVAKQRVDAIVGSQHRKSYDKAAVLTAACAEVLRLRGNREAASALVDEIRNRFPRHRAFQAELNTAIQRMERSLRYG